MPFEVTSTNSVLAATPITLARHSAGRSRHRVARAHRPFHNQLAGSNFALSRDSVVTVVTVVSL
jgi:hypothetical protein